MHVTCTCGTIQPLGPNGLCVTCTCGTFLHLHPTYGTLWFACHLLPSGFSKFKLKKTMRSGSRTQDPEQGIDRLHHYARCPVVLTCLWSSICSLCGHVHLYIGYIPIPCKWKQICARWTWAGGGNEGSPVCYGGLGFLLEARRWIFLVEHDGISVHVHQVPR